LNYTYQEKEGGIAEAVGLCEDFVGDSKMVIILGDNIIEKGIRSAVGAFREQKSGARILLKKVKNPREYGIAEIEDGRIVGIVEKPKEPKSDLAVIGVYMYDHRVFELVRGLSRSARGELEITDVNNLYLEREELAYSILEGHWADAGESIDALLETNLFVKEHGVNKESR
jgi:glucose-1-phosphate thymidylyltransferase